MYEGFVFGGEGGGGRFKLASAVVDVFAEEAEPKTVAVVRRRRDVRTASGSLLILVVVTGVLVWR